MLALLLLALTSTAQTASSSIVIRAGKLFDSATGDKVNTQFRAEFFNIFNHPAFALPSNILAAPNFGALYQTPDAAQNNVGLGSGGPRLIQFAFKVSF